MLFRLYDLTTVPGNTDHEIVEFPDQASAVQIIQGLHEAAAPDDQPLVYGADFRLEVIE